MGRKLKDASTLSDPEAQEATTHREARAEKKKKKHKNKHRDEEEEEDDQLSPPKRKLEEVNSDSKKKKKKHKKSKESVNNEQEPKGNGDVEESNSTDPVVMVTGKDADEAKYKPLDSFAESKLPSEVLQCCVNFQRPSPIQSRAWPFLLDGRDFIGIAKTGSGKTLAFGIPAINQVLNKRNGKFSRGRYPLCLVLAPTRELAQQVSFSRPKMCFFGTVAGLLFFLFCMKQRMLVTSSDFYMFWYSAYTRDGWCLSWHPPKL